MGCAEFGGTTVKNPNCDNDKCRSEESAVRILPYSGGGNLILCRACFDHEIAYRRERNHQLTDDCKFLLPTWESLEIYA